jgi:hypothetical protein
LIQFQQNNKGVTSSCRRGVKSGRRLTLRAPPSSLTLPIKQRGGGVPSVGGDAAGPIKSAVGWCGRRWEKFPVRWGVLGRNIGLSDEHSVGMMRLYFGLAALAGMLFLFEIWLAQHEQQAAIDRLERYEIQRTQR